MPRRCNPGKASRKVFGDPLPGLEQDYNRIDAIEEARSAAVAREMGLRDHRSLTFIPSVIVEYDRFWKHIPLLAEEGWLRRAQRRRRRGGQFGDMFLPI